MRVLRLLLLTVLLLIPAPPVQAQSSVVILPVKGAIGPATVDYLTRGLEKANRNGAKLAVLQMDTPGGLDSSMRDIIQAILSSPIPVATYVAPSGARAASAGTYILYASHIAAMAPGTNLGAATPVQIGGLPMPKPPADEEKPREPEADEPPPQPGPPIDETATPESESAKKDRQDKPRLPQSDGKAKSDMEKKTINDARAYIRSLAQLRNRNVEWAEQAVTEAASLSAEEALEQGVIDIIATDVSDLLRQIDGRIVQAGGQEVTLATEGATVETVAPDWRNELLAVITHPQVAYILMLLGVYGLFFELSNPGAILPGVLGGICLLLALFAFQVLPINYAGLALILLGLMFMIGEAFVPSFGALGLGGVVAFVVGSLILWDEQGPGFEVPLGLILGFALASAVVLIGLATLLVRQRRRPIVSGDDALLNATGEALQDFDSEGWIRVQSESWKARTDRPLRKGQQVCIVGREGMLLDVKSVESEKVKT